MLRVRNLSVSFSQYGRGLRKRELRVIRDLSVDVGPGEIVAVVGSSGSGKSLLAHAIMGILPANASYRGEIDFDGTPLTTARQKALRGRDIALIPQSVTCLDPLMRVGRQARLGGEVEATESAQRAAFARYGLGPEVDDLFPFQLSGGMARKVLFSTAVLTGARLIIADEPTPGLDRRSLDETLAHLTELASEGRGVLLITHDLDAARQVADRVAFFYAGTTIEVASRAAFAGGGDALRHPYARALVRALPTADFAPIPGAQPMPDAMPRGCPYAPRCERASEECETTAPPPVGDGKTWVRCHHAFG